LEKEHFQSNKTPPKSTNSFLFLSSDKKKKATVLTEYMTLTCVPATVQVAWDMEAFQVVPEACGTLEKESEPARLRRVNGKN
jgi:hypothetical protein